MTNKEKLLLFSLAAAVAIVGLYTYSHVFLDIKVSRAMEMSKAPANYQRLALVLPTQALTLVHPDGEEIIISHATLQGWIEPYHRDYTETDDLRLNSEKLQAYLDNLGKRYDQPAVNAKLDYKNGKIIEFNFPAKGKILNTSKTTGAIYGALANQESQAGLVFDEVEPEITLDQIENLGIKKLIGRGESNFTGSSAARIHNIKTAAKLYDGVLLKPGEEFSFNNVLGDVDASTGYLPELVIKKHGLVKEYGGGICQVATTVFRAAIYSGLKILERRPHSFPVKYYNPQGFDATIYPGQVDLRFVNNTDANIVIQTKVSGTKLVFEFYGDDDRTVTVGAPIQYDVKPSGAMKAVFTRTIEDPNGETRKEEFRSSYNSPLLYPTLHNRLE